VTGEEKSIADVITERAADAVLTPDHIDIFSGFGPNYETLFTNYRAFWDVDDPSGSFMLYGGGKRYAVDIEVKVTEVD
jgi:hypothetical protein